MHRAKRTKKKKYKLEKTALLTRSSEPTPPPDLFAVAEENEPGVERRKGFVSGDLKRDLSIV